jgi:hypothetical protein
VQTFLIVDIRDEAIDPAAGVTDVGECLAVDLFGLERLHEAFSLGVVKGIARPAHADGDVAVRQSLAIGDGCVLHATIGVVDQAAGRRLSSLESFLERRDGKGGIQRILKGPTDGLARERVENDREIGKGLGEMDIGNVRDPDLIRG